ncbi:MAG TPA: hypothetical protein VN721_14230 [Flavipsychrobacter sp.]|nr:hypothetical protein [Flavipsychrobacter sp.]
MSKENILQNLSDDQIEKRINNYTDKISHIHRYASFDYCYNYFQSFRKKDILLQIAAKENIELSVLQLTCYLASWGMFRGSTALLRHSSHALKPVIEFAAATPEKYWEIDIDNYDVTISDLTTLYCEIGSRINIPLVKDGKDNAQEATAILVTKILLGIFGCTPAMDEFFIKGIGKANLGYLNYQESIDKVKAIWQSLFYFYTKHKFIIDSKIITSLQFDGTKSSFVYTKAKLIDMLFFERGNEIIKQEKEKRKNIAKK